MLFLPSLGLRPLPGAKGGRMLQGSRAGTRGGVQALLLCIPSKGRDTNPVAGEDETVPFPEIPEAPVPLPGLAQTHLGGEVLGTEGTTPLASPVLQASSRKAAPAHGMPWAA